MLELELRGLRSQLWSPACWTRVEIHNPILSTLDLRWIGPEVCSVHILAHSNPASESSMSSTELGSHPHSLLSITKLIRAGLPHLYFLMFHVKRSSCNNLNSPFAQLLLNEQILPGRGLYVGNLQFAKLIFQLSCLYFFRFL